MERVGETPNQLTPQYFDIQTGQLLVGKVAVEAHVEAGGHPADLHKLADLLTDRRSEILPGTYPPLTSDRKADWPQEECINYAHWLNAVVKEGSIENRITLKMLERAYRLGIAPGGEQKITSSDRFGNLTNFLSVVGVERSYQRGLYDHWTTSRCIEYVRNTGLEAEDSSQSKPSKRFFVEKSYQGNGPSPSTLEKITGHDITKLLDMVGYFDAHRASYDDFIDWGVRFMLANQGKPPKFPYFNVLSRKKRGPSVAAICDNFGGIRNYRKLVLDKYESRIAFFKDNITDLPKDLFENDLTDYERIRRAAQYTVLEHLGLRMEEWHKKVIARVLNSANFVSTIRQHTKTITEDQVRAVASKLGVYDDIWMLEIAMEHLKVPESARRSKLA